MKTNLRNRPAFHAVRFNSRLDAKFYADICLDWKKWFEALEKQLREYSYYAIEEELIRFKQEHPHRLLTFDDVHAIVSNFLGKILGDDSP